MAFFCYVRRPWWERGRHEQGVLGPGRRPRPVELSRRFDVSRSVVREALTRLSGQGLVTAAPQPGGGRRRCPSPHRPDFAGVARGDEKVPVAAA
ncbi:GntR family transcriptional regulator [Streptomyces sp. NPDC052179]|uniref:GntR family transcriptional regulator n=1 Tax=Streptomyces sp. NPDC052179 TaxID=3155680 RepID=UPI0034368A4E